MRCKTEPSFHSIRRFIRGLSAATACVACLSLFSSAGATESDGLDWRTVEGERRLAVYAPDTRAPGAALVLLLHGGGGSIESTWSQEVGVSWRSLADRHGFVICLPEGRSDPGDHAAHHWNDCRIEIVSDQASSSENDVGFILSVLEDVVVEYAVSRDRVYAAGVSNGGMMAYRLAIEAGAHFAGIAAVIANLADPSECGNPASPIPMLIMNGSKDPIVPAEGGCVTRSTCDRGRVMSTAKTVAFWVNANLANPVPQVEKLPDRDPGDRSTVTVYRYAAAPPGAPVVFYDVIGAGHSVPGSAAIGVLRQLVAGGKNRDIDGPAEIWAFFSALESQP